MTDKQSRGGKREGAGRPEGRPTKTKTFRIDAQYLEKAEAIHGRTLNQKVNALIKRLSKP